MAWLPRNVQKYEPVHVAGYCEVVHGELPTWPEMRWFLRVSDNVTGVTGWVKRSPAFLRLECRLLGFLSITSGSNIGEAQASHKGYTGTKAGMSKEYIEERSGGMYVAGTRVSLASVVLQFRQGAAPETILQDFPALASLENVYGAITYYLANQPKVEEYLKAQKQKWEEFRKSADPLPPSITTRLEGIRR